MKLYDFIAQCVCYKNYIDTFLEEAPANWARFDPELGYVLKTCSMKDGVDESFTIGTYMPSGERRMMNYADRPCRINTYGDSFTQCHQVNDGETWQEYLAGHFGEPVRNFGIGGYGAWQAYRRLLRQEARPEQAAEYLVFNIFSDDHMRSVDRWRWIRIADFRREMLEVTPHYFHATPWTYLRLNPETQKFESHPQLCAAKQDLYRLCDPDYLYEEFRDDLIVHIEQARRGGEFSENVLREAADLIGLSLDLSDPDASARSAKALHEAYSLKSTEFVLQELSRHAEETGKKLLIVMSYSAMEVAAVLNGKPRFDASLFEFMRERNLPVIDLIEEHRKEFANYRLDAADYLKKYYVNGIGHYNPAGNHFCAYAVKPALVDLLNPKPFPYTPTDAVGASQLASRLA